jgi:hypothetical protein
MTTGDTTRDILVVLLLWAVEQNVQRAQTVSWLEPQGSLQWSNGGQQCVQQVVGD